MYAETKGSAGHIIGGQAAPKTKPESHDLGEEEEDQSYNYLYDQEQADDQVINAEAADGDGFEEAGLAAMQQDTSANRGRADSGFGAMGLGEFPVAPGGAVPHHGKAKIQKLPPEKYAL